MTTPKPSGFVQDLESAVNGQFFKCTSCSHTYVIDGFALSNGRYHVKAYDLTAGHRQDSLTPECVEAGLRRTETLTVAEARNFANYQSRQKQ